MIKKIVTYLTLFLFINFVGCYSSKITAPENYQNYYNSAKPDEIYINTIGNKRYHFGKWDYYIYMDTLHGKGFELLEDNPKVEFNGKIAIENIETIEWSELNQTKTYLFLGAMFILSIVLMGLFIEAGTKQI